jgi:hypothetical protein
LFYKNLADNKTQNNNGIPNINEIKEFWSNIWSNEVQFNNQAEWIPNLENEIPDSNDPHHIQISLEILVKNINSSHNWKSPEGEQIHNFWLKKFTCIHKCLLDHFNGFIREPNTFPEFLAHGITYMKPKDSDTKNPSKYRPITCLPTIYKMTSCIKVIIYDHCQKINILNEEQKGCVKECFGCKEQLIIDTVIMEQARKNNRNIYTVFIDYKKAYDSVPHSWLIKILKIYKINLDLINFLSYVMTFWRTTLNLSINNTKLKSEPIQIKRGIYQGDSLSLLWFCLAINPLTNLLNSTGYGFNIRLNNTTLSKLNHLLYMDDIKLYASKKNHILSLLTITENFSNDIGMSFGIDKCKTQSICRGHYENLEYITKEGEIFRSCKRFRSESCLRALYFTLVRSKLEYCSIVWSPIYRRGVDALESVQRKFAKYLLFKLIAEFPPRGTPNSVLYDMANLRSLNMRRNDSFLIFLYKIIHGIINSPFLLSQIYFNVPRANLRSGRFFYVPRAVTNILHRSPLYTACTLFNSNCSECDIFVISLGQFKRLITCISEV